VITQKCSGEGRNNDYRIFIKCIGLRRNEWFEKLGKEGIGEEF
jgi:hypothetical protein